MEVLPKDDFECIILDLSHGIVNNWQKLAVTIPPKEIQRNSASTKRRKRESGFFKVSIPLSSAETNDGVDGYANARWKHTI